MFRSDAHQEEPRTSSRNNEVNIDNINIDIICEIEKELHESPYDVISLVFLLYDVPDTALQRLIFYQRVAGDATATKLDLLQEWAQRAKTRSSWKHEFLEALLICQLYGIVKKLGFHLPSLKKHYQPNNLHINMHINPMKKALYKVCENIDSANLARLKSTLRNFKIDTMEFDSCELIFLKLMSEKFITMTQIQYDKKVLGCEFNVDKLVKILIKLPGLENLANELRLLQSRTCDEPAKEVPVMDSTPLMLMPPSDMSKPLDTPMTANDFNDIYEMMKDLNFEDENPLKSDTKTMDRDKYTIKNTKSMGVCLIINQEDFCLSEKSIEDDTLTTVPPKRNGSTADKRVLEKTMSSLNFEVVIGENLNHIEMIELIKNTIRDKVKSSDSIFMLCILSHGVRGHVYAADCVKVNVENIQGILDSDEASMLQGIPKVLIIQACQVDDTPQLALVADSPGNRTCYKKSDFLIYWATAPQYEAFRNERNGSVFIQLLCVAIQKRARKESLPDICTLVNKHVQSLCRANNCPQVPLVESTLRKKLYLQIPE